MRILLASPRGFCAGVNMAIESLELALAACPPPIFVYHEIVHNQYVVRRFRDRGVTFVNELAEVPLGATLLFSAHGVAPEVRRVAKERRLRTIDATCPLVTKVHLEAIKYARLGYTIVLIGHEGHDEVIGTMGEAPQAILLVESPEDVDALDVAGRHEQAVLLGRHQLAAATDVGRYDPRPGGHRLDHHVRQALVTRREQHDVYGGEQLRDVVADPEPADPPAQPTRNRQPSQRFVVGPLAGHQEVHEDRDR